MPGKCVYCHNDIHEFYPVAAGKGRGTLSCCSKTCAKKTLAFCRFYDRTKVLFFIGIAVSMILLLGSAVLLSIRRMQMGSVWMGASFVLLGFIIFLFPFATPQTFQLLGIRKTVWVTRLTGLCIIALGPLLACWVRA